MEVCLKPGRILKIMVLLLVMTVSVTGCMGALEKKNVMALDEETRNRKTPKIWDTSQLKPNHVALAKELMDKGFYDVALVQLKTALEKDKTSFDAYNLAGVCARETGKLKKGLDYFEYALLLDRDNASAHNNIAILFSIMGQDTSARNHFKRAVALDPARAGFFNNLGYFLMDLKEYGEAETRFNQALVLEPSNENVINNLAICLGHQKKDDRALKLLMEHQPLELAFYNMGCIYKLRNETSRADAMFELSRRNSAKSTAKKQKAFDLQVMNPSAPVDPTPADGMSGDVAHTIYTKKYLSSMKSDANALEDAKE
ncbi:MAG: tetratricopeptide repeat protein [Desulfobacterium sp.]|nr:tetratricopeptide repeat protein [Desulfobacterium sp.]